MARLRLSICIATYNRAGYIGETLESIIPQLTNDVELLVVDGASTDNTREVMHGYLQRSDRVRYVRLPSKGGVDQDYDRAVELAEGEFCWLFTDDDVIRAGAVQKVLSNISYNGDLVIINAQVRNADLSKTIAERSMQIFDDREYGENNHEEFFSTTVNYLSFIGCVVIRRSIWRGRNRAAYYGSLFIHVGIIFQRPVLSNIRVIAEPLIVIRYGNAMWTPRAFEIWMFLWPNLIWSFSEFSDLARGRVYRREPWRRFRRLFYYRAIGGYGLTEYRKFLADKANLMWRVVSLLIAVMPGFIANILASIYGALVYRKFDSITYDLSRSRYATRVSRLILGVIDV